MTEVEQRWKVKESKKNKSKEAKRKKEKIEEK